MNKIGIIARVDSGGLSALAYDFWKHIHQITKALVVLSDRSYQDLQRYPDEVICPTYPTLEKIEEFLKDIDIVLAFETPYNWNVFSMAKERGIKTVLMPMYEWTEEHLPIHPDLYLCPSLLDYDIYKDSPTRVKYLPVPVDRKVFQFKLRKKAETFLFNNGYGGSEGRNGLTELLEAIPLVKSDVEFTINSQIPVEGIKDDRVLINVENVKNSADLFEGDVFLFPQKFGALTLPIREALSCGMPVLSTDFYPHNTYKPKDWFWGADGFKRERINPIGREIDVAILSPKKIAEKIDEWANKNITKESKQAEKIAEKLSWKNLHQKYIDLFNNL